jgi:hypothetical protein
LSLFLRFLGWKIHLFGQVEGDAVEDREILRRMAWPLAAVVFAEAEAKTNPSPVQPAGPECP